MTTKCALKRLFRPALLSVALLLSPAAHADEAQAMRTALSVAAAGDWNGALSVAPSGVGHDVIEWQRLRASEGRLGDYEAFLARRTDWPGLPLLREKGEVAVARSTDPARVIAYFATQAPRTGTGAAALIRALQAQGQTSAADETAMRAWSDLPMAAEEEATLESLAPAALDLVDEIRLDRLLWDGDRSGAKRMLSRVGPGWQALATARLALQDNAPGVTALIAAVPEAQRDDPGLAYDRFDWRMRQDLYDDAAALILERSETSALLGRPEAWADRRATLARRLMREGKGQTAYRVAARHQMTEGTDYADLEFLAGFIALRHRDDPDTALTHFRHLEAGVSTPISLARAAYWQGRALQAAGQTDKAATAYQAAAQHQTAYYGLLAAERLGLTLDAGLLDDTRPGDWRQSAFANSSVLDAARLLIQAGDRTLAKRFYLHLAEGLNASELDQLADLALTSGEPHIAVLIGKAAAERGIILPRAYFPVPDMVPDGLSVSRALALSITRRESEFDPTARSTADARGLMQLLPATGKQMAAKLGLPYQSSQLFTDPALNVRLGSAYLAQMVEEFGPSIALVASGYNAGPGRPRRWISEFGDPRRDTVDVVDWVETIPFAETRTYVMRVVEGVVIYRAKLKGAVGPVRITSELKG